MKDISFLRENIIAHRGLHNNLIPENSIEAFKRAIKQNYIIELDVHIIKDNTIVVFHDDNLKRMTNIDSNIKDYTYEELLKLDLLNTNYKIPKFIDVLKLVDGKVPIIVELKCDQKVGKLERELIKILDNYQGTFCIKSFDPLSIIWFRLHRKNYIRGLLISNKNEILKEKIVKSKLSIDMCKPDFLSCNYNLYNDKIIKKYKNKIPIIAWTIKTKNNYLKYKEKFDNLICENTSEFLNKR